MNHSRPIQATSMTAVKTQPSKISEETSDLDELVAVEETFAIWVSRREETIKKLEDIATYIDSFTKKTVLAKAIGSGTGILGGGLTVVGGALTIVTAGAAVPILLGMYAMYLS